MDEERLLGGMRATETKKDGRNCAGITEAEVGRRMVGALTSEAR